MKTVWVIARYGDGSAKIDSSGLVAYEKADVAREDLNRHLFPQGYSLVPLTLVNSPILFGTFEQRIAWEKKRIEWQMQEQKKEVEPKKQLKTTLTYKDGRVAEFIGEPGHDSLEIDLDGSHTQELFSIVVTDGDRTIFSAVHWRNEPLAK